MYFKEKKNTNKLNAIVEVAALVSPIPMFITDRNGIFVWTNNDFLKLYGYDREDIINKETPRILRSDATTDEHYEQLWEALFSGETWRGEIVNKKKDGTTINIHQIITPVQNKDDEITHFVSTQENISEIAQINADLAIKTKHLEAAQRIAKMGHWRWDVLTNAFTLSRELATLLGFTPDEEILMSDYLSVVHEDDQASIIRAFNVSQSQKDRFNIDHRVVVNGKVIWLHSEANVEYKKSLACGLFGITQDVTERYETEKKIKWLAEHDPLTHLPNRALFNKKMENLGNTDRLGDANHAIFLLDLDYFKEVNDTLGHDCGDELLIQVSARIIDTMRESDTVYRLGGDEFAIVLDNVRGYEAASTTAAKLINVLRKPYVIFDHTVHINSSIGITISPDDGKDPTQLFKQADLALYKAKDEGRGQYRFFVDSLNTAIQRKRIIEEKLRSAIANKEFIIHLQPKTMIRSDKTHYCNSAEALLRWHNPELGYVSPVEFIPVAESAGLIKDISIWLLEESCNYLEELQKIDPDFSLSVNISPSHLKNADFCNQIERIIKKKNVNTKYLDFEITENLLLDNTNDVIKKLNYLSRLGITFSIDDFGTGYSSLGYLKKFPVTCLKIDKMFIDDIGVDKDNETIVIAVSNLAKSLGMDIIAEGVEDEKQLDFLLLNTDCRTIQGYYYSKPLDLENFIEYLKDNYDRQNTGITDGI